MPLILSEKLINNKDFTKDNIFVIDKDRADHQDIRPLKLALLNLMPNKEETDLQFFKLLSNQALQVEIDLVRVKSYQPKHTDPSYLDKNYLTFDQIKSKKYDGMIITGAPLEKIPYDQVKYWEELKEVFDFAKTNVYSTMFVCWAAKAALYYYYDVNSVLLENKIFGVYPYEKAKESCILNGLDDEFVIPQSRFFKVEKEELSKLKDLEILASSDETGLALASSLDKRFIFSLGHLEYGRDTLHKEYIRDLKGSFDISAPINYYQEDGSYKMKWQSAANIIFHNWLNYAVYQETPYEIDKIKKKSVSKFGGSSLSDSNQFQKVKEIINSDKDRDVIVVSAPGKRNPLDIKVTDMLIDFNRKDREGRELENLIAILREKQEVLARDRESIKEKVKARFLKIHSDLGLDEKLSGEIISTINSLEGKTSDYVLSRGEYLNAKLMAAYLGYKFIDAFDLITFSGDEVDLNASYQRIRDKIHAGDKVVVPGFYGKQDGKVKVFKRGGSDYTGSILASALESKVYENWTDVDGIMTADPNKDQNAKTIERLSYENLIEIISSGASVYQLDAIKPVMDKNISLQVLNTNSPRSKGTLVRD